jgi:hypothetical protein
MRVRRAHGFTWRNANQANRHVAGIEKLGRNQPAQIAAGKIETGGIFFVY